MLAAAPLVAQTATRVAATGAAAGPSPVVVELFTSQGCSSCPPADALLNELAGREDVLPLALHVDYWDYIGWRDAFADPAHTSRQKGYAHAAGRKMIYTPQMIVMGQEDVVGAHAMELADLIMHHMRRPSPVLISAQVRDGGLHVVLEPVAAGTAGSGRAAKGLPGPFDVHLVRYTPLQRVHITRGENAGRNLEYANVVDSWDELGHWDGTGTARFDLPFSGDRPAAVLVQQQGFGPIVGAIRVMQ